jgi:large subunit ribosomal protein L22
MAFSYSVKKLEENMAKAAGLDLPISYKQALEICNYIRKNHIVKAKEKLENAISMKRPIPFKKFTNGLGHKKGELLAGRYPIKACTEILKLLKSAEANALFKGLNSKGLVIFHLSVKNAAGAWHYGRQRRRRMKRCHVEIILKENPIKKDINIDKNKINNVQVTEKSIEQNVQKKPEVKKTVNEIKNVKKEVVLKEKTDLVKKSEGSVPVKTAETNKSVDKVKQQISIEKKE